MQKTKPKFPSMKQTGTLFVLTCVAIVSLWIYLEKDGPGVGDKDTCEDPHIVTLVVWTGQQPTAIEWLLGTEEGDEFTDEPKWSKKGEVSCGGHVVVRATGDGKPVCQIIVDNWELPKSKPEEKTCAAVQTIP